jgi:hypothetical protein
MPNLTRRIEMKTIRKLIIAGTIVLASLVGTSLTQVATAPPALAGSQTCAHQNQGTHHWSGALWHAVQRTSQTDSYSVHFLVYEKVVNPYTGFVFFKYRWTSIVRGCPLNI